MKRFYDNIDIQICHKGEIKGQLKYLDKKGTFTLNNPGFNQLYVFSVS